MKRSPAGLLFILSGFQILLLKTIAKKHVSSPQSCINSCHSVAFVQQMPDKILDDLLIELIYELD